MIAVAIRPDGTMVGGNLDAWGDGWVELSGVRHDATAVYAGRRARALVDGLVAEACRRVRAGVR